MTSRDTYAGNGITMSGVPSLEEALALVRESWPGAYKEGSTGFEYSFFAPGERGHKKIVGHAWSRDGRLWKVRVLRNSVEY